MIRIPEYVYSNQLGFYFSVKLFCTLGNWHTVHKQANNPG